MRVIHGQGCAVVALLTENRSTLQNGRTALHEACSLGLEEFAELLLDSGANPDERAWAVRVLNCVGVVFT